MTSTPKETGTAIVTPEQARAERESAAAGKAIATIRATGALANLKAALQETSQVEEDPTEGMVAYIQATPAEEWEGMWAKLPNLRDNAGKVIRLFDFRVAVSTIEGNEMGAFLVGDVAWTETGERGLLSIGSTMCMAQAITLKQRGQLPADLEIVQKPTKTRAGFQPIHFRYLGRAVNAEQLPE